MKDKYKTLEWEIYSHKRRVWMFEKMGGVFIVILFFSAFINMFEPYSTLDKWLLGLLGFLGFSLFVYSDLIWFFLEDITEKKKKKE